MYVAGSDSQALERANIRHLVLDIAWFGLALPSTTRFMSIYAIRLGATPLELGWLSSLPAIMLLIASAWSSGWRARYPNTIRALFWPALAYRLAFFLVGLTPFLPPGWQVAWLILAVSLPALPQGVGTVLFLVMMRESVRPDHLRRLVSYRLTAMNVAIAVAALAYGVWLEAAPFPLNYQVMFLLSFVFTLASLSNVLTVHILYPSPTPVGEQVMIRPWRSVSFRRVAFVAAAVHVSFFSASAVIPLRLVNELGASEGFMALFGVAELVAGAVAAAFTNRIGRRIGNLAMSVWGMIGAAAAAAIIALFPRLELALVASALTGASWMAVVVGLFSFFSETTPVEDMTRYTTAYNQTISLAIFVGPMLGSVLANGGVALPVVLLLSAGLRLLAGVLSQQRMLNRYWRAPETAPVRVVE